jgi:hypothetical protein
LIRNPWGLWVVDLQSREGILVNGVKVRWAWLDLGDVVKIGRLSFKVWYDRRPEGFGRDDMPITAGGVPPAVPDDPADPDSSISGHRVQTLTVQPLAGLPVPISGSYPGPVELSGQLVLPEEQVWQPPGQSGHGPLALWQRQIQIMESFHRDMMLTVQMFFAMNREQHTLVRDEIAKVEQITQEMRDLQRKLAGSSRSDENGCGTNRKPPAPSDSTRQEVAGDAADRAGGVEPPRPPGSELKHPANGSDQTCALPVAASSLEDAATTDPEDQSIAAENAELHQRLTQRINDLQRERQRYWQRILSSIRK